MSKVTVKDLLTMTSGIHDDKYDELVRADNWVIAFLKQEFPHTPGTFYRYCTHGSHLLSAIITKVSGQLLVDFLDTYLFSEMKIPKPQWETSPEGYTCGGMGLSLSSRDLLKIGQLLMSRGEYLGKQLISKDYLSRATTKQVTKQADNPQSILGQSYGFQFHISQDSCYRADGAFGQLCFVSPKDSLVLVATSTTSKMTSLLQLVYDNLLDVNERQVIKKRPIKKNVSSLKIIKPLTLTSLQQSATSFEGLLVTYRLVINQLSIDYLIWGNTGKQGTLTFKRNGKQVICLNYGQNQLVYGETNFIKDTQEFRQKYCTKISGFTNEQLLLTVYFLETPYIVELKLTVNRADLMIDFKINTSFSLKDCQMKGRKVSLSE